MQPRGRARHTVPYPNAPFINRHVLSLITSPSRYQNSASQNYKRGGENSAALTLRYPKTIENVCCSSFSLLLFSCSRLTPLPSSPLLSSPLLCWDSYSPGSGYPQPPMMCVCVTHSMPRRSDFLVFHEAIIH